MLFWGPPSKFVVGASKHKLVKSEIHVIDDGRTAERLLNWINKKMGRYVWPLLCNEIPSVHILQVESLRCASCFVILDLKLFQVFNASLLVAFVFPFFPLDFKKYLRVMLHIISE